MADTENLQKLNAIIADRVREAMASLVGDIKDDLSRALDRLGTLQIEVSPGEISSCLEAPAAAAAAPAAGADLSALKEAFREIESGRSQVNVLTPVIDNAGRFASRAAIFVIKQSKVMGWKAIGFEAAGFAASDIKKIQFLITDDTLFKSVRETPCVYVGSPGKFSGNSVFLEKFGGSPTRVAGFPIVTKNKISAIIYADDGASSAKLDVESLALLAQFAGMAVDLIAVRPKQVLELKWVADVEASAPAADTLPDDDEFALDVGEDIVAEDIAKSPEDDDLGLSFTEDVVAEEPVDSDFDVEFTKEKPVALEPAAPAFDDMPTKEFDQELDLAADEAADEEIVFEKSQPTAAPAAAAAPQDEEHEEAQRFARLLVSEIKLYNEGKVKAGRKKGDLYDRLRDDIDRSKKVYGERVSTGVTAKQDYFYDELVSTLAGGNASLLGNYPK